MKQKKKVTIAQGCALVIVIYSILAVCFYFIGGEQLKYTPSQEYKATEKSTTTIGEIRRNMTVMQTFIAQTDEVQRVSLLFATGGKQNPGVALIRILNMANGKVLAQKNVVLSSLANNAYTSIGFDQPVKVNKGETLGLTLNVPNSEEGKTISVWFDAGNTFQGGGAWFLNGVKQQGTLCIIYSGRDKILFGDYYWDLVIGLGILLAIYCINLVVKQKKGKRSFGLNLIATFLKYRFLLHQLVSRDFKTKYKRSVLGVFWSFLNPLLSMTVQYVVFSTLFKSNISNFAVYLLTGIVFFNFFSEATGMGLGSIVGNASLITKVYIPKYIFPVSRVLSSVINLLISIIPLIIVMMITRTPITPALLLLPFSIVCIIAFCIGMSFLLSSAMVFFRDMQFLWNVVSMLWVYATPIFYPESILPQKYIFIFKLNPLYHFIRFARTIILNGVSPEPKAYLFCLIAGFLPLVIGAIVFKRTQNKFILNL
ncbi:teichoic acid translocation permease protein TagG [Desulfosporosinus acididurans]|uniref:Transport permease protein n=1 Tax=Desulfosporosinus acididurans TaxID=476652 RepID=A0A0J1FN25_9FIRM|nr:ABC transporter permease [Desulfosporosinus acididurans]KLU64363.1 teichoic acid translocation permease protein TagG [Desulfosporosinus acididurans]